MPEWIVQLIQIFIFSGMAGSVYVIVRNYLWRKYENNDLVKSLIMIADQVVQESEKRYGNDLSGSDKYKQAIHKFRLMAEEHGIELPQDDVLKTYIEAAVKRLDTMATPVPVEIENTNPVMYRKHVSGKAPKE